MPPPLNPVQKVWVLFALELLVLVALLITLERFQTGRPEHVRFLEWNSEGRVWHPHPQASNPASPARSGHAALVLSVDTDEVVDSVCLVLIICSCWLAHATYTLHRLQQPRPG